MKKSFIENNLENIDISDEEIRELTKDLNFDRIKELSLSGIKRNNIFRPKKIAKRILLFATIFVIGIMGTAFAIEQLGNFKVFLDKDSGLPQKSLVGIDKDFSAFGVTMKVENMVAGVDNALLILSFTNDDGSIFPENARADIELYAVDKNSSTKYFSEIDDKYKRFLDAYNKKTDYIRYFNEYKEYEDSFRYNSDFNIEPLSMSTNNKVIDDGKKLVYYIQLTSRSDKPLNGKIIKIVAHDIYNYIEGTKKSDKSLTEVYNNNLMHINSNDLDDSIRQSYEKQCEYILKKHYPEGYDNILKGNDKFGFSCLGFYDDIFYIGTCVDSSDKSRLENQKSIQWSYISSLTDTRNGATYKFSNLNGISIENKNIDLQISLFENIKQEDLEYMVPEIYYNINEILTLGIWTQEFVFNDKDQKIQKDVDITLDFPTGKAKIEKINVSAINLSFSGDWLESYDDSYGASIPHDHIPDISLELIDGTYIDLKKRGGYSLKENSSGFIYNYEIYRETENKTRYRNFLDISQIKGIKLNDNYIPIK